MKTIILEPYVEADRGFSTKAILLNSIVGYENFESYVILPTGKICSGKGGKFKRLNTSRYQYALSYQKPFQKFHQVMLPTAAVAALVKDNLASAEFVMIEVR